MDFNEEFNYKKQSKYIDKPGVYDIYIRTYSLSEENDSYTGSPFIEFLIESKEGKTSKVRLYRATSSDNDYVRKLKTDRIKEFIADSGANTNLKGKDLLADMVDKKVKILMRTREYVGQDEDGKPIVKTVLEYAYSRAEGKEFKNLNETMMHKELTPKMKETYESKLKEHNSKNTNQNTDSEPWSETDEAPF
tara:strand:- start:6200 stop:6775 length:576 start_codon:yes stop_codon:yes gene_type:complete